ncbi:MAG: T9SS type A sorting domain-containing protein [Bacteroidota bacterium]
MDRKGIMLHIQTQETENELLLDGGNLGVQRKLYYRELVARFGYHHAITWNLGEENEDNTTQQRKDFASYIHDLDPYDHPIVVHTLPGQWNQIYDPLLDLESFDGPSLQVGKPEDTHWLTLDWVNKSAAAGKKWYVCMDESGPWQLGATPDGPGNNHDTIRKEVLWANLMAGGGGVEWYFGYDYPNDHDLSSENFQNRENVWNITRYAVEFFQNYLPYIEMKSNDGLATNGSSYTFAKEGEVYAVYLKNGGTTNLNLAGASGTLNVQWYDPRNGGGLQNGSVTQVNGGGSVSLGQPPNNTNSDWVALVSTQPNTTFGDATSDGNISALDASLILQHSIEIIILPGSITPVIDVSGNGDISAFDASLVLQHVVELISCFPVDPACGSNKTSATTATELSVQRESIDDQQFWVHVSVNEQAGPAQSLSLTLNYNPEATALADLEAQLPDGWQVLQNETPGVMKLAIAGLPSTLSERVLSLRFDKLASGLPAAVSGSVSVDEAPETTFTLQDEITLPDAFVLDTNYPNPFNPETTIRYAIPEQQHVKLTVFDMTGRAVGTLVDQVQTQGAYSVRFDAANLPSGTYLYRIEAGAFVQTRKMTLVK